MVQILDFMKLKGLLAVTLRGAKDLHRLIYLLMVTATRWEKFNFLSQLQGEQLASRVLVQELELCFTSA